MARIRGKDTKPEMLVRRLTHGLGYRYRLHGRKLPGKPDLVFSSRKKVIFVHGCFWHRHVDCRLAYEPKSNVEFWQAKFASNVKRDREVAASLKACGWKVLVIWECETKDVSLLQQRITTFLDG